MAAPKGNKFWKLRSKHGRDKIFESPEILLDASLEFVNYCEENPLYEYDYKTSMKNIRKVAIPKMRVPTWQRFAIFCNSDMNFFSNFRIRCKNGKTQLDKDFIEVLTRIDDLFYSFKFEGAAAGLLNASIIARDLGLRDSQDHDHKSSDGTMSPKLNIVVRDEGTAKNIEKLDANN